MKDLNAYINSLRHDFSSESLDEKNVYRNPFSQFEKWLKEAIEAKIHEPNAMSVSTATKDGKPSSRIVLLRNFDENGFVFYSNYTSRKGEKLASNPNAALLFFWPELGRQVHIEGLIEKQSESESDSYFKSRPYANKLGAWASNQSKVIANRSILEEEHERLALKFPDENIPRPPYWGGYVMKPSTIEFWQGRESRLHDRILYTHENLNWKIERLAP